MTIIIGWAHVGFKYFSFILGMGFPVLSEHPVRHGLKSMLKLSDYENEEPARKCAKPSLVSKRTKSKSATTARVKRASSSCSMTKTKKHRSCRAPPNLRTRQAKEATPDDPDADKELRAMMDIDDGKKES